MWLPAAELEEALRQLGDFSGATLVASDPEATEIPCPRCTLPLGRATLTIGPRVLEGKFLRCDTDGVWVPHDELVVELARTSRRPAGTVASASNAAAGIAPSGSPTAAALGIGRAFSQNQRLPIAYRPPRVRTAFVSAFEGRELSCPACDGRPGLGFVGDRWTCKACSGAFVEDAALIAMVSDIRGEPWELPEPALGKGSRTCPVCTRAMRVEQLGGVEIDRCVGHGIWFDEDELGRMLLGTGEPPARGGLASWIKRLFSRG